MFLSAIKNIFYACSTAFLGIKEKVRSHTAGCQRIECDLHEKCIEIVTGFQNI